MDQVLSIMKTETRVAFVGGTSAFVIAFCLLKRLQARTIVMALEKHVEDSGVVVYDCIVCLCEVSPRDEYKSLPNCVHGVQFQAQCMDAWLKDHSTCPVSHIPRPLSQRLHNYLCERLLEDVVSYSNSALDNVASSIGDCHYF